MFTLPAYLLELLVEYLPALDAREMQSAAAVALLPHMADEDRTDLLEDLNAQAALLTPAPAEMPIIAHDPEAAARYFEAMGIKTTSGAAP